MSRVIIKAWLALMTLSAATAVLALIPASSAGITAAAGGCLLIAGLKARLILAQYLRLANSAFWMGAFNLAIGAFLALSMVVYVIGHPG